MRVPKADEPVVPSNPANLQLTVLLVHKSISPRWKSIFPASRI